MLRFTVSKLPQGCHSSQRILTTQPNPWSSLNYSILKDETLNLLKDPEIINPPRGRPVDFDEVKEEKGFRVPNPTGEKTKKNEQGFYEEKLMAPANFPSESKSDYTSQEASKVSKDIPGNVSLQTYFSLSSPLLFVTPPVADGAHRVPHLFHCNLPWRVLPIQIREKITTTYSPNRRKHSRGSENSLC